MRKTSLEKQIWKALDNGLSVMEVSRQLEVPSSTVSRSKKRKEKANGPQTEVKKSFNKNKGKISSESLTIKTVPDLIEYAEIDTDKWKVTKSKVYHRSIPVKAGTDIEQRIKYEICIWVEERKQDNLQIAIEEIVESLKKTKPKRFNQKRVTNYDYLLELGLYDSHFAMLAWHPETLHGNYDLDIARQTYVGAVTDILNRNKGYKVSKIIFPVGHDFFHTNDPRNVTPKAKNSLDTDGRHIKIFNTGVEAVIEAIELCRQIAPVEIIWVPGNHDPQTSYYLTYIIDAHFNSCKNVTVDRSPNIYKAKTWGNSFIGFAHGENMNLRDYPRLFIDDFPELWSKTKYREIHTAHFHTSKKLEFLTIQPVGQTNVRQFPSLCTIDAWHYAQGYRHNPAALALYWDKRHGLANIAQSFTEF